MIQKLKKNRESFIFSDSWDEERVNEKDSNCKTSLRVKSNEEVFKIIQTKEILSESYCSEIEENKTNMLLYSNKFFEFSIYISLINKCNLFFNFSYWFLITHIWF